MESLHGINTCRCHHCLLGAHHLRGCTQDKEGRSFNAALRPQRPYGQLATGEPGTSTSTLTQHRSSEKEDMESLL